MNLLSVKSWLHMGILFSSIVLVSCQNEETNPIPKFHLAERDQPWFNYMYLTANIDSEQRQFDFAKDHGFVYGTSSSPSIESDNYISLGSVNDLRYFSSNIEELIGGTTYYVRAYIQSGNNIHYSNEIEFTTRPGTWIRRADFPDNGVVNAATFNIGQNGYVIKNQNVWVYNFDSDIWIKKNDLPFNCSGGTGFTISGIGYIYCSTLWKYDEINDSWDDLSAPENRGCNGLTSFVINDKVYIGGGDGNLNKGLISYDPTNNAWSSGGFIINPNRSYAKSFTSESLGVFVGGKLWVTNNNQTLIKYNFTNGTSSYAKFIANNSSSQRQEMICFTIGGKNYAGMGYGELSDGVGVYVKSHYDFYLITDGSWVKQTFPGYLDENDFPVLLPRVGGISLSSGNRAFMGLGENRVWNNSTSQFDRTLLSDLWEFIP